MLARPLENKFSGGLCTTKFLPLIRWDLGGKLIIVVNFQSTEIPGDQSTPMAWLQGLFVVQIILTHEHADAVLGLDDVWVALPCSQRNDSDQIPIFLTQFTLDR